MAHVSSYRYKNGKIVYRVRFRLTGDGNGNPVNETFSTIEAAQNFAALIDQVGGSEARKIRDAVTNSPRSLALEDALKEYLEHVDSYAARGTAPEYRRIAERTWLPRLGKYPITAITRENVAEWIKWQRIQPSRRGGQMSYKTLKNAHSVLSQTLQYFVDSGDLDTNPAKGAKIPRDVARQRVAMHISREDYKKILAEIDPYYLPLIEFLYATGARFGEATAVPLGSLFLDHNPPFVRIWRAWKKDENQGRYLGAPKSQKSNRDVSFPAELVPVLRPLTNGKKATDLVFTNKKNQPIDINSFRRHTWNKAVERAGVVPAPRIHDLRHTNASELIIAGVPLPVVQERLGHESIKTTVETYGHLNQRARDEAVEALAEIMK